MTVSSNSTVPSDDSYRYRRTEPPMPKMCFCIPIKAAAIFGVASSSILASAMYIYSFIHLLTKNSETNGVKIIPILTVALVIILFFAILFFWGTFANRHRLLLPFTTLTCYLLFAAVGTLIATIARTADEFNAAVTEAEAVDIVIFRVELSVAVLVLAIKVYVYMRMFLHIRAVKRVLSR